MKIILTASFDSLERSGLRNFRPNYATLKFLAVLSPAQYSFLRTQQRAMQTTSGHS
jgi:hypothetical protein